MTREIADRALTRLGVDDLGLDGADRRYLRLLAENYGGGPVGVETIAAALSEVRDAIEEVIEPFLLQQGLIQRTPRGRMLAARAWTHLGLAAAAARGRQRRPVRGRLKRPFRRRIAAEAGRVLAAARRNDCYAGRAAFRCRGMRAWRGQE